MKKYPEMKLATLKHLLQYIEKCGTHDVCIKGKSNKFSAAYLLRHLHHVTQRRLVTMKYYAANNHYVVSDIYNVWIYTAVEVSNE